MRIMECLQNEKAVRQNLADAGCSKKQIDEIILNIKNGEINTCLKLLTCHRTCLLDNLHSQQKCIDCLDYLIYNIEKENGNID